MAKNHKLVEEILKKRFIYIIENFKLIHLSFSDFSKINYIIEQKFKQNKEFELCLGLEYTITENIFIIKDTTYFDMIKSTSYADIKNPILKIINPSEQFKRELEELKSILNTIEGIKDNTINSTILYQYLENNYHFSLSKEGEGKRIDFPIEKQ